MSSDAEAKFRSLAAKFPPVSKNTVKTEESPAPISVSDPVPPSVVESQSSTPSPKSEMHVKPKEGVVQQATDQDEHRRQYSVGLTQSEFKALNKLAFQLSDREGRRYALAHVAQEGIALMLRILAAQDRNEAGQVARSFYDDKRVEI